MIIPDEILGTLPEEVVEALGELSETELSEIYSAFSYETGDFIGIRTTIDGVAAKIANPEKAHAIDIIESQIKRELANIRRDICLDGLPKLVGNV